MPAASEMVAICSSTSGRPDSRVCAFRESWACWVIVVAAFAVEEALVLSGGILPGSSVLVLSRMMSTPAGCDSLLGASLMFGSTARRNAEELAGEACVVAVDTGGGVVS